MTRRIWPFVPRQTINEGLEWATDVFMAKASEQRIALRTRPRRSFQFTHYLNDHDASYARTLIRNAQGEDGFWVPDWTQAATVSSITAGSGVAIATDLSAVQYGDYALIWESVYKNEVVSVTQGSPENVLTGDVVASYTNPYIMPVWMGDCPEGLSVERQPKNINSAAISFILSDDYDISASSYPSYRSNDLMTDVPVISSGTFTETEAFPVSSFGSSAGDFEYIRSRDYIGYTFQMRWHTLTGSELYALRQWLHSRKGRQKAFWLSTSAKDLECSSISGTTVTVFNDILARPSGYDIEIYSGGTKYQRQVTGVSAGTDVGGRPTVDLTINSSVPVSDAERISCLICSRLDSDRIEITHENGAGAVIAVPCREVPIP
jgi:hypothetical protein